MSRGKKLCKTESTSFLKSKISFEFEKEQSKKGILFYIEDFTRHLRKFRLIKNC